MHCMVDSKESYTFDLGFKGLTTFFLLYYIEEIDPFSCWSVQYKNTDINRS